MNGSEPLLASLLNFKRADTLPNAEKAILSSHVVRLEGCCEFAAERVFAGASGRKCRVDKSICVESNYSDPTNFTQCFLRTRELNYLKRKAEER